MEWFIKPSKNGQGQLEEVIDFRIPRKSLSLPSKPSFFSQLHFTLQQHLKFYSGQFIPFGSTRKHIKITWRTLKNIVFLYFSKFSIYFYLFLKFLGYNMRITNHTLFFLVSKNTVSISIPILQMRKLSSETLSKQPKVTQLEMVRDLNPGLSASFHTLFIRCTI